MDCPLGQPTQVSQCLNLALNIVGSNKAAFLKSAGGPLQRSSSYRLIVLWFLSKESDYLSEYLRKIQQSFLSCSWRSSVTRLTSFQCLLAGIKRLEPGAAYFPAVSLSHGEACELNFGAKPILYPVSGFLPLQPPPRIQAKRTILIPPTQKQSSVSPGSGSLLSPEATPTAEGAAGPVSIPVSKPPLNASSPPPLELPFSSVPDRPTWEGPTERDSDSPEPLPNLTPVTSPKDSEILHSPGKAPKSSKPLSLPELPASPRAKYLLKCLERLLEYSGVSPQSSPRGRSTLCSHDVLLFAALLVEQLAPLLLGTVPGSPPRVKPSRLKQPKQAPAVPYYVIWDALVPWLVQLAESKPQMLERALDMLVLCLELHELRKVVIEVMEALSYRSRTALFSSETLPYTGSYRYLKLACALARRREVLECWWQSWGFEESLEGLLTKKAVNKNDLAALLPQVRSSLVIYVALFSRL